VLRTRDLTLGYRAGRRQRHIADGLELSLNAGEFVCLIGPNGAGKSTLMRTLAGLQPPLAGTITLLAQDISSLSALEMARQLSIVLTERLDSVHLSAYELVALGRYPFTGWAGALTAADQAVIQEALALVGALALAGRSLAQLSDGEGQKVMIARALAQETAVILLDEPTAYLDLPRRVELMSMLRGLTRTTGRAVLLSTHDLDLALRTADWLWLLDDTGHMAVGVPEDLVLTGALERSFASQGVQFEPLTGAFRHPARAQGEVSLKGEGLGVEWTRRALERVGLSLVEEEHTSVHVIVEQVDDRCIWRIHGAEDQLECGSIGEMLGAVHALSRA
jgi:iron complex transport system ATP-binding protein